MPQSSVYGLAEQYCKLKHRARCLFQTQRFKYATPQMDVSLLASASKMAAALSVKRCVLHELDRSPGKSTAPKVGNLRFLLTFTYHGCPLSA